MLPTQFTPEYYRDSKDIINAEEALEPNHEELPRRRSLFSFILGIFRRSEKKSPEDAELPQVRLDHR